MTLNTIDTIRELIEGAPRLSEDRREALLTLLESLKKEVSTMESKHIDRLKRVVNSTENMTRGHLDSTASKEILEELQEDVFLAIREFEVGHPKLVTTLQALCTQNV